MAYKQPRVPQLRDGDSPQAYAKELMLFLRDFCMAAWNADRRKDEEISALRRQLDALRGEE